MSNFKKVLAMVLAVAMLLSVTVFASASTYRYLVSPTKGDTTNYTRGQGEYGEITTETHKDGSKIVYKDTNGDNWLDKPMITDVTATKPGTLITVAGVFNRTEDEKGNKVHFVPDDPNYTGDDYFEHGTWVGGVVKTSEVQQIGSGSYGIAENDEAGNVTGLNVKSKAPVVTVASKALQDSKIANIVIDAENVQINKNATKGTKAKTVAFAFPQATKAKQITVKKGAFNGAKKVRIVVSSKMSSKELKKLRKKLKRILGSAAYKKVKVVRG